MKIVEDQIEKTIEEIVIEKLEKKGITKKSKFHVYDYLYKTIVDMMKDYEEKLQENEITKEIKKENY